MKIAVASGKGGTGKTTVALALAEAAGPGTQLFDCDVEEPNCHLFINVETSKTPVTVLKPEADESLCNGCRECCDICQFNAIAVWGSKIMLFPDLCHGCGGCTRVCPTGALTEKEYKIGNAGTCDCGDFSLTDGCLSIGQAMAPPLIHAVQERIDSTKGHVIIDSPPGTSCPMIASTRETDFVVLVTEPTPFGLHDLSLAVDALQLLKLPMGVIINRADQGNDLIQQYCQAKKLPVLLEIPLRRDIAEAYSCGKTLLQAAPELKTDFEQVLAYIEQNAMKGGLK